MSTRVEKGGAKFKPTAKPRSRLSGVTSRHASTAPDARDSTLPQDGFTPVPFASSSTPIAMEPISNSSTMGQPFVTPLELGPGATVIVPCRAPNPLTTAHIPVPSNVPPSNNPSAFLPVMTVRAHPVVIVTSQPPPPVLDIPRTAIGAFGYVHALDAQGSSPSMYHSPSQLPVQESISAAPARKARKRTPREAHNSENGESQTHLEAGKRLKLSITSSNEIKVPRARKKKTQGGGDVSITAGTVDGSDGPTLRKTNRVTAKQERTNAQGPTDIAGGVGVDVGTRRTPRRKPSKFTLSDAVMIPDESGDIAASQPSKRRRLRSSSVPRKPRRSKAPSLPSYDPDVDPGEELDPTAVTMANLCEDTGQGRVSSKGALVQKNHAAWKASSREKRARMRSIMEAKKYGRGEEEDGREGAMSRGNRANPVIPTSTRSGSAALPGPSSASASDAGGDNATENGFNYSQSLSTTRFNVQVRLGPNGETIIDEESLFVDRVDEAETANEEYTHIEESDTTKFVNSTSYSKKLRGSRWTAEETELFFDALSQFGENYELISYVLPGRDRKSCQNKFKTEDRKNPARITFCLNNRVPYDINTLSRLTGKDFSGPTPEIGSRRAPDLSQAIPAERHTTPAVRKRSTGPDAALGSGEEGLVSLADDPDGDLFGDSVFEKNDDTTSNTGSNFTPAGAAEDETTERSGDAVVSAPPSGSGTQNTQKGGKEMQPAHVAVKGKRKGRKSADEGVEVLGILEGGRWED